MKARPVAAPAQSPFTLGSLCHAAPAWLAALACLTLLALPLRAQMYFDVNGATAGSGVTNGGTYNWPSGYWSTSSAGTIAPGAWAPGSVAVFLAGSDGGTNAYTINLGGTQTVGGFQTNSGYLTLSGGTLGINTAATPFTINSATTISSVVAGTGFGISKLGSATLYLTGANTYTGPTSISAGTLNLAGNGTLGGGTYSGTIAIGAGATFEHSGNANQTLSGVISGAGNIIKSGTGTLLWMNNETFTGATTISAGTLQIANGATNVAPSASGSYYVGPSGTFKFYESSTAIGSNFVPWAKINGSGLIDLKTNGTGWANGSWGSANLGAGFTGNILIESGRLDVTTAGSPLGGTGSITVQNGAAFTVYGVNTTVTQAMNLAGTGYGEAGYAAAVRAGSGYTATFSGPITLNGATTLGADNGTAYLVLSGNIGESTASGLTANGGSMSGTVILTGTGNSWTGGTTVSTGTLKIGGAGTLGSGTYAGAIVNNANFFYSSTANQTLSGTVSGTGALVKDTGTTSTLTLTGANTYTGPTSISAGTLNLAGNGTLGGGTYSGTIAIGAGATFEHSGNADQTLSGVISGAGNIIKSGTGTLLWMNNETFTGATTISAGTLQIGNGTNNLMPSASGSYYVGPSGTFKFYESSTASGSNSVPWAKISGSGLIDLKTNGTGWTNGAWGSVNLGAGFTGNILLESGRLDVTTAGSPLGGTGSITVQNGAAFTVYGVNTTVTQAMNLAGTGYGEAGYAAAVRAGSGNTATFSGPITLNGATTVGADSTTSYLVINGSLGESTPSGLTVNGGSMSGTVLLHNGSANSLYNWTGGTTISTGTLMIDYFATLGDGAGNYADAIVDNGVFNYAAYTNQTLSGGISGTGSVIKGGTFTSTLYLSGTPAYTGNTSVYAGTLKFADASGLANVMRRVDGTAGTSVLEFSGGAYNVTGWTDVYAGGTIRSSGTGGHTFSNAAGGNAGYVYLYGNATIDVDTNAPLTISSGIGQQIGTDAVTKTGAGTLYVLGSDNHTGNTTISAGTLWMSSAAFSAMNRRYDIASGATVTLNDTVAHSGVSTIAGPGGVTTISGAGTLAIGTGTIWFNQTNDGRSVKMNQSAGGSIWVQAGGTLYNGGWSSLDWTNNNAGLRVDGTFDVWDGNNLRVDALTGSGSVNLTEALNLPMTIGVANGSGTFTGTISNGPGTTLNIIKTGTGRQLLTGGNSYTGITTVSNGILAIGSAYALGVTSADTYVTGGALEYASGGTGVGEAIHVTAPGTPGFTSIYVTGAGNHTQGGTIDFAGSIDRLGIDVASGSSLTLLGELRTTAASGSGNIRKSGAGELIVQNINLNLSKNTVDPTQNYHVVNGGTLTLGGGQALGPSGYGTFVQVNANAAYQLGHSGSTISSMYGVHLDGGTSSVLALPGSGTQSGAVVVANGGTIHADTGGTGAISGVISGAGGVVKSGAGLIRLTTQNTYSGGTTVSGGTLELAVANALKSTDGATIDTGDTLKVDAAQTLAWVAGTGTLELATGGNLTLSGLSSIGTLHITGNSTLTFGAGNFSTSNFIVDSGVTFSVSTAFLATNWWTTWAQTAKVAYNTFGTTPYTQVTVLDSGVNSSFTRWDSADNYVKTPEPSTYGAMMLGAGLLGFGVRRWRQQRRKDQPAATQE